LLFEVSRLQGHVGGAEIDGLGGDLLDAATRADRLIVHLQSGLSRVGFCPFGVDRVREGGASAINLRPLRRPSHCRGSYPKKYATKSDHELAPSVDPKGSRALLIGALVTFYDILIAFR